MKGVSSETHYVDGIGYTREPGEFCHQCSKPTGRWWTVRENADNFMVGKPFPACSWECAKKELEG